MTAQSAIAVEDVADYLGRLGVLLETDRKFPSITGIMVREPIKGSWWAHPMANDIYMLSQRLTRHPDTIFIKLLSGKTTFVHRRLWPELIAIGTAHEPWQLERLSSSAKAMLRKVEERGQLRMDEIKGVRTAKEKSADAHSLAARLLVFGDEVHTDSGHHVKRIETWEHWAWRTGFNIHVLPTPDSARSSLAQLIADLNTEFGADATLPWQPTKVSARRKVRA